MFSHAPKLKLKGQIERTKILTIIAIIIVFSIYYIRLFWSGLLIFYLIMPK